MKFKQMISISTSIVLLTSSLYSDSWSSTQNEHGFILKTDDTTLYLGKSCDAISPQYGRGEWYWKDNDVIVSLSKKDFSFNSGSLYEDGRCSKGNTNKSSEKSLPALPYHWIYDQNGCKHYNPEPTDNETLTWTGSCKNGYGDGYGKTVWYKNGIKVNSFNETKTKGKAEKKGMSDSDKVALAGAALVVGAGLNWLFGGSSSSSSSSSSDYSSSSSSSIDYVQIEADCINGLFPCIEENLQVTGGTGRFEPSFNKASTGTIYKDYQGNTAGTYSFSVKFDDNLCTGSFYVSGQKKHYTIALGKDCNDNGSREW